MARVIDADTHIIEHPGVWEHFDSDLYAKRPILSSTAEESQYGKRNSVWLIDGVAVPKRVGRGSFAIAVGGSDSENARTDIQSSVRYITDPEQRVRDMDARGVDLEVVYPTMLLAYVTDDVELEVAICKAYNRYMADAWKKAGDRLRWVVVPPLRDIEASVREIEFASANGAVGVFFRGVEGTHPVNSRKRDGSPTNRGTSAGLSRSGSISISIAAVEASRSKSSASSSVVSRPEHTLSVSCGQGTVMRSEYARAMSRTSETSRLTARFPTCSLPPLRSISAICMAQLLNTKRSSCPGPVWVKARTARTSRPQVRRYCWQRRVWAALLVA